jgi:hypothetical protein
MSDTNAKPDGDEPIEPTATGEVPGAEESAVERGSDAPASAEPTGVAEQSATGEVSPGATGEVPAAATGEVAPAAPVQTVYVTAPVPPRKKGNRGIGSVLAIIAAIVFAAAYLGVAALLILFVRPDGVADAVGAFATGPLFYVPVLAFLVLMVLWALLANRASWWAWVLGSLVIAVLVYFVSIGALLLIAGGFGLTAGEAAETFARLALNPVIIAAALLAREAAVWFGAAIAARGRRVRERNYAAWEAFEREEAEKRAEFSGRAVQ